MKKVIERIVESPGAPNENDLWLNGTTLKKFQNGEWVIVGGSSPEEIEAIIAAKVPISWEVNLIRNQSYATWESVNMTQEIYDAIINGTIDPINIKWYYTYDQNVTVAMPIYPITHTEEGVINVRSGFAGAYCTKAYAFEINPDGTVRVEWD